MDFFKRLTLSHWIVIIALVVGTILRFWNFENTLQFLGDQGRDAIIAKRILKDHDLVLIGPVTSTGNMYLGPLYYYFMVPFLAVTYPDPLGPAYAVAVLSVLTIFLMYYLGKELVGERAAALASLFLATSYVAVTFSRFSWNPNLAPLAGLVLLWACYRAITRSPWYFVLASVCISVLIQLHYVTLLAIPATGIVWLLALHQLWQESRFQNRAAVFNVVMSTMVALAVFALFFSPLVLFDLRHDGLNLRSLQKFLTEDSGGFNNSSSLWKMLNVFRESHGRSLLVLFDLYIGKHFYINSVLVLGVVAVFSFMARAKRRFPHHRGYMILLLFIAFAIIGLSFYQSSVFPHYISYLFPVTCLVYGVLADQGVKSLWGRVIVGVFLVVFGYWNFTHMPFRSLSWTVRDIEDATQTILDRVQPGEKYNIVLLTGTGDIEALNYRYFLETSDKPPLPKEEWPEVETLFIINEDKKLKKVVDSPIYEIVVFPNKNPAEVYTIPDGPEITVLRRK